jgi:L-alanine-DL-glutamate epimerase-like enolase superfamily enzyme
MKITGIEAFPFRLPLRRKFRWASLRVDLGGFVFVRINTDEGLSGIGEATPLPDWGGDHHRRGGETQHTVVEIIRSVIAPALEGLDPTAIGACHLAMDKVLKGNSYAKNAVDMALHDLWGKALGQPLYRLLGGKVRDGVKVAHMIGIMPNDDAVAEGEAAFADGIRAFQVKGGEDSRRDVDLIRRLRDSLGEEAVLRLDINQGYRDVKQAIAVIEALDEAGLDYVEQPATGLDRMAEITAAVRPRIIADESCWDARDALDIVERRGADCISIYLAKAGGILKARRVAAVASAALVDCDVNGSIESAIGTAANVHFALAEPCVTMACVISVNAPKGRHPNKAGGHYYEDDVVSEPLPWGDGMLLPPEGPGLGIALDEDKLERFRED